MFIMKYIQFAIMAALVFGIAASPVLSNGLAFADEECDSKVRTCDSKPVPNVEGSDKTEPRDSDKTQPRDSDKEQRESDKTQG